MWEKLQFRVSLILLYLVIQAGTSRLFTKLLTEQQMVLMVFSFSLEVRKEELQ